MGVLKSKSIIIEGIGGIGGPISSSLIEKGYKCTLITSNQDITDAINTSGIKYIHENATNVVQASVYTSLNEIPEQERFDIALLIMKANSVVDAAEKTLPFLKPDGYIVTMQNGIVEDKVLKKVNPKQLIPAIIGWGGTMTDFGVYAKTTAGHIHIGELDGVISDRLNELKEILSVVSPVTITDNIQGARWSKLAINCTITSLGAICGQILGVMLKDKNTRKIFLRTYSEVIEVGESHGIKFEKIAANPYLLYLKTNPGFLTRIFKDFVMKKVGKKYADSRSSSLQSLERGRKTEIDFLNGYVVDKAVEKDIAVPLNTNIVNMIKEIEDKKREITPDNFKELIPLL